MRGSASQLEHLSDTDILGRGSKKYGNPDKEEKENHAEVSNGEKEKKKCERVRRENSFEEGAVGNLDFQNSG